MKIDAVISNIEYFKRYKDIGTLPDQLAFLRKLRDWTENENTLQTTISTKQHRSNASAVRAWIKVFFKGKPIEYVCRVTQNENYKNDSVTIYYREF